VHIIKYVARCLGFATRGNGPCDGTALLSPDVTLGVQVLPMKFSYLTRGKSAMKQVPSRFTSEAQACWLLQIPQASHTSKGL